MNSTKQLNEKMLDSDALIELDVSELAQVAGGTKTDGGHVSAGWSVAQGATA